MGLRAVPISPWTRDSYWFEAAGGNHGSNISRLTPGERLEAETVVQRWAGVAATAQARSGPRYVPELDDYNPGLDRSLPF